MRSQAPIVDNGLFRSGRCVFQCYVNQITTAAFINFFSTDRMLLTLFSEKIVKYIACLKDFSSTRSMFAMSSWYGMRVVFQFISEEFKSPHDRVEFRIDFRSSQPFG